MRRSTYNLQFRRRREKRTDYKHRRSLISSGLPRLVVRGTNSHIIVQLIKAYSIGDKVLASANSKELIAKYDWKLHCGNVPSAYLTGLLAGKRAKANGLSEAVLDMGLKNASKGNRIFAALKGTLDSGIKVPCNEKIFPDKSRIRGEHIADYAKTLDKEAYIKRFSRYAATGMKPEDLPKCFEETKNRILQGTIEAVKSN